MSLWKIAWRSIQQRALASSLTAVSMALGVSLVVAVLVIHSVVRQSFHRGGEGYDLIVGASKGSRLELVLGSVYYLGQPIENIPYSFYKKLREGELSENVELAIPLCLGDNYEGYRVIGTVPEMFDELHYLDNQTYHFAEGGRNFESENYFEAVIGSTVAKKTGLKVGDTFRPTHDVAGQTKDEHRPFTVVGVLEPTGTPNDRALFVNIEGFYRVGRHAEAGHAGPHSKPDADDHEAEAKHADAKPDADHHAKTDAKTEAKAEAKHADAKPDADHHAKTDAKTDPKKKADHDEDHDEHTVITDDMKKVTAVLVCTDQRRPSAARTLAKQINESSEAQAAIPSDEISRLFDSIIGNIEWVLLLFAVMIVLVAGIGIMVSIYNSMSDRRHEIAIMRSLGASRMTVMLVILFESILLSLGGGLLGLAVGHGLIAAAGPMIAEQTGVAMGLLQFRSLELILIPGLLLLATVVGYLPAVAAYRTDVARSLQANP